MKHAQIYQDTHRLAVFLFGMVCVLFILAVLLFSESVVLAARCADSGLYGKIIRSLSQVLPTAIRAR